MWNLIKIDNMAYIFKHTASHSMHNVFITNLISFWQESLSDSELLSRCQELNPLIEADSTTLIENAISLLHTNDGTRVLNTDMSNNTATLDLKSKLGGIPFSFVFNLKLADQKTVFHELTLDMVIKMQNLQMKQNQLIDVIKKKDLEINQYKVEGAQLSRKHLETAPFDEMAFFNQVNTPLQSSDDGKSVNVLCENSEDVRTMLLNNIGADTDARIMDAAPNLTFSTNAGAARLPVNNVLSKKRKYMKQLSPGKMTYDTLSHSDESSPVTDIKSDQVTDIKSDQVTDVTLDNVKTENPTTIPKRRLRKPIF